MSKSYTSFSSQAQINKVNSKLLRGKKDRFVHIANVRYLYVRMQQSNTRFSASYVCRFTKNGKSYYHFLGTIKEISLAQAIEQCAIQHSIFSNDNRLVVDLKNFSVKINGNSLVAVPDSENGDINTGATADISMENLSDAGAQNNEHSTMSMDELLSEYAQVRNLKDNTIKAYKTAVFKTRPAVEKPALRDFLPATINKNFSRQTLVQYLIILKSLFRYAQACGYIKSNPFANTSNLIVTTVVKHRAALGCENFDTEDEAKEEIGVFIKAVAANSRAVFQKKNLMYLWILHMVLATRISETARVVNLYNSKSLQDRAGCKYLLIETKTTKRGQDANFRVPLIPKVKILLEKVCKEFGDYSFEYLKKQISLCIPKDYRGRIKVHGTRAIYRTIIDFIGKDFDLRTKEYYINHNTLNKVAQAYSRGDLLLPRMQIQELYTSWLEQLLSKYCQDYYQCFKE